jgi:protein SCO1
MKRVILGFLVVGVLAAAAGQTFAQAIQHYNSPLYSPRSYEQDIKKATIGLPPVLDGVGIEQKLDSPVPLETKFKDEDGNEVELNKYFVKGKPVIIALVYYECPMLCNEVLNGLTGSLKALSLNPGKDFEVVAISFNPKETPELAKAKKETYMKKFNRTGTENGWHFLTGSEENIENVAQAVGFRYKKTDDPNNAYAHAGGIMIATPEGKLSRYLYGIDYAPKDVKLALIESSANKIGSSADQLLLYCYHYDPSTGKYGLAIMRIIRLGGVLTIIGMAGLLLILWRSNRAREQSF